MQTISSADNTPIAFERSAGENDAVGTLSVDRSTYHDDGMGSFPASDGIVLEQEIPLRADGTVDLDVYIDQSVVEVFVNDREYIVSRLYPPTTDHRYHDLAADGAVTAERVRAYQLASIWPHFERDGDDTAEVN